MPTVKHILVSLVLTYLFPGTAAAQVPPSPDKVGAYTELHAAAADTSIADNHGVTPLEHAKRLGYGAIIALFPKDVR